RRVLIGMIVRAVREGESLRPVPPKAARKIQMRLKLFALLLLSGVLYAEEPVTEPVTKFEGHAIGEPVQQFADAVRVKVPKTECIRFTGECRQAFFQDMSTRVFYK